MTPFPEGGLALWFDGGPDHNDRRLSGSSGGRGGLGGAGGSGVGFGGLLLRECGGAGRWG
jgi:hypothetical protein